MLKNKIVAGLIILVVLIGGWMLLKGGESQEPIGGAFTGTEEPKFTDPRSDEVAIVGKLGCLPLKSGAAPAGDTCIIGLLGDDAKFYALNTSKVEVIEKGINLETPVRLVGSLAKANTSNEEAGIFKYDGVLSVRVMQSEGN